MLTYLEFGLLAMFLDAMFTSRVLRIEAKKLKNDFEEEIGIKKTRLIFVGVYILVEAVLIWIWPLCLLHDMYAKLLG